MTRGLYMFFPHLLKQVFVPSICLFISAMSVAYPCAENFLPTPKDQGPSPTAGSSAETPSQISTILRRLARANFTQETPQLKQDLTFLKDHITDLKADHRLQAELLATAGHYNLDASTPTGQKIRDYLNQLIVQELLPQLIQPVEVSRDYPEGIALKTKQSTKPDDFDLEVYDILVVWAKVLPDYIHWDGKKFSLNQEAEGALTAKTLHVQRIRQRVEYYNDVKFPPILRDEASLKTWFAIQGSIHDIADAWNSYVQVFSAMLNHLISEKKIDLTSEDDISAYKERFSSVFNLFMQALGKRFNEVLQDIDPRVKVTYIKPKEGALVSYGILNIMPENLELGGHLVLRLSKDMLSTADAAKSMTEFLEEGEDFSLAFLSDDHQYVKFILRILLKYLQQSDTSTLDFCLVRLQGFGPPKQYTALGGFKSTEHMTDLLLFEPYSFVAKRVPGASTLMHELNHGVETKHDLKFGWLNQPPASLPAMGGYTDGFNLSEVTARVAQTHFQISLLEKLLAQLRQNPADQTALKHTQEVLLALEQDLFHDADNFCKAAHTAFDGFDQALPKGHATTYSFATLYDAQDVPIEERGPTFDISKVDHITVGWRDMLQDLILGYAIDIPPADQLASAQDPLLRNLEQSGPHLRQEDIDESIRQRVATWQTKIRTAEKQFQELKDRYHALAQEYQDVIQQNHLKFVAPKADTAKAE